jgi:hypothetical protein
MKTIGLALCFAASVGLVGCGDPSSNASTGDDQNLTATGAPKTVEALISEAFTARRDQALVIQAGFYLPKNFDVGSLGAKVAEIAETEDGGYEITFATAPNCTSLDCIVLQISASTIGTPSPTDTLNGGVPAEFNEGCGAHGCDKFLMWKKPGLPTGFTPEFGGNTKDFVYEVRVTKAPLDKAALVAFANSALAAGPRSINDILIGEAMAKNPSFAPRVPLLYPPSFGVSGRVVVLRMDGDGYQIDFATEPNCSSFDCMDMQVSAMALDVTVNPTDSLLSGTPAEFNDGCGAHGCDQFVEWKSNGVVYTVRHLLQDENGQHMSSTALIAMASAAEAMGARHPR